MSDQPRDDETAARIARDAALQTFVSNAVYLAMMLGLTVAITKRDVLIRRWMWARSIMRRDRGKAAESRALAELRRDISAIEHGGGPDTTRIRGLYERGQL